MSNIENSEIKITTIIVFGLLTIVGGLLTSCQIGNKTRAKMCVDILNSSASEAHKAMAIQQNCRVD